MSTPRITARWLHYCCTRGKYIILRATHLPTHKFYVLRSVCVCVCVCALLFYFSSTLYFFLKNFLHVYNIYMRYIYILFPQKSFRISDPLIGFDLSPGPRASRSLPRDHDPFVKKNFASLTCLFLAPFAGAPVVSIRLISVQKNRIRFDACQKTPVDLPCVLHAHTIAIGHDRLFFYVSLWKLNR